MSFLHPSQVLSTNTLWADLSCICDAYINAPPFTLPDKTFSKQLIERNRIIICFWETELDMKKINLGSNGS